MHAQIAMTVSRHLLACLLVAILAPQWCDAAEATLFRIFLVDGSSVISYGEYSRVNDRIIFSMPVGGSAEQPRLQVVTLAAARIDWPRTEQAATAVRYQQYVATRGDEDFTVLSNEVARVLNDIALSTDPAQALAMAEQARRVLTEWPRAHYNYRQDEVREIVGLIDEAIARLRGTPPPAGFELSLVAHAPSVVLDPPPTLPSARESVDQLMHLTSVTPAAADRMALLQAALALLSEPTAINTIDGLALRRSVEERIRDESAVDARYARLTQRLVGAATRAAARANVTGVERVLTQIPREDVRLGAQRPATIESLRAAVTAQLDSARRLRLLRDQWAIRRSVYREYEKGIQSQVLQLVKAEPSLEAIRRLDGPDPDRLIALRGRLSGGAERLQRMTVVDDLRPAHDLLVTAWRFAEHAVDARYLAVSSGSVATAWEASSAAAGALMMLSRAQAEVRTRLEPPRLP
jgi:hypothetical protein